MSETSLFLSMETFTFEELRARLENLIQVLKVLLRHSEDKTHLATFLSTISCQWREPEMQMVKFELFKTPNQT